MKHDKVVEKTLAQVLAEFRATATSDSDKGTKFERLTKFYLIKDPIWSEQLANVRLREEAGIGPDVGIDLVADDIVSGGKVAIQCKFYDEKTYLDDLGTFYTSSGKDGYVKRIVVTTSNLWTRNAEEALKNQQIPVQRVLLHDMEQSLISWGAFDLTENYGSVPITQKELRPHQADALKSVMDGFKDADRGKVIMACGTGKTLVSLRIAEEFFKKKKTPSTILFLAPSISLLSQTIMEWGQNKKSAYMALAVCSDSKVGKKDDDDMQVADLAIPASTDVEKLAAALGNRGTKNLVIFSTYQSLEIISKAQKGKKNPLSVFDLVVCDEAHRTTGVTTAAKAAVQDFSHFVRIHNNEYVKASKRLYMTATPKIYKDVDNKVSESGGVIASMDDPENFGEEFYRLGFGTAVERGLLSDYRVLILAVDEEYVARVDLERFRSEDSTINLDDASKLLGCWRGLSKIKTQGEDVDHTPMKRAVAFANTIEASQVLAKRLDIVGRTANRPTEGNTGLLLQTRHVDGKQNALVRRQNLEWLKADPGPETARILTNARCLSEGIDVPALDAVIFTEARGSQVDIVQAVGRVMRRYEGKNSGYIILPVAITAGADINSTLKGTKYNVIWDVLNALRAHDDRFDVVVNQINLNQNRDSKIEVDVVTGNDETDISTAEEFEQGILVHLPSQIADGIYAKIVEKVGERQYWEKWAHDIADIASNQEIRIRALVENPKSKVSGEFDKFLQGIRDSINNSISKDDAIEMLAQHLITKPIFEALFKDYNFAKNNPVSISMDKTIDVLSNHIEKDERLTLFYESVNRRVSGIDNNVSRQKLITELYEKFFRIAFPRMTQKLGIVYTPIEIVDFIINSVNYILERDFDSGLSKKNVHILDPFTGTGTFIVRLLQSGLIPKNDLKRKFLEEMHANEIVLLAYYIGAINIESTFADMNGGSYLPFEGIVLTDTFQMFESKDVLDLQVFLANSARSSKQIAKKIQVIFGNPPYSIGQGDANDNNQNIDYPDLDESIKNSYVLNGTAKGGIRSLYDSYYRAFRWASNRIEQDGVVCFVTNGTFLDSKVADGFRKSLFSEFNQVYVMNLRGGLWNKRGEAAQAEGGNVFGQGSMTTIAITLLVKNSDRNKADSVSYFDIGDHLTTEEKLNKLAGLHDLANVDWDVVIPNEQSDWINQRSEVYEDFIPLLDKNNRGFKGQSIFVDGTQGLVSAKDSWAYNFSRHALEDNVSRMIGEFKNVSKLYKDKALSVEDLKNLPKSRISWDEGLLKKCIANKPIGFEPLDIQLCQYRPFARRWGYRNNDFIWSQYRTRYIFPNDLEIPAIAVTGASPSTFSTLAIKNLPDFNFLLGMSYPLYLYEIDDKKDDFALDFNSNSKGKRRDGVTDYALDLFKSTYSDTKITKENIFQYTYAVLNSKEYIKNFAQDARKSGAAIPLLKDFKGYAQIGEKLLDLHLNYDSFADLSRGIGVEVEIVGPSNRKNVSYRVEKMKIPKDKKGVKDFSRIVCNESLVITNIPEIAYEYSINGRSAIEWVVDQHQIQQDKSTGNISNPNEFSKDEKYSINTLLSVIYVGYETSKLISQYPNFVMIQRAKKS